MALEADRNQIAVFISAAMSFGFDVVNRSCRNGLPIPHAFLAQVPIAGKDARPDNVPLTAIAALVAAQPPLMLLPAFVAVSLAVTRAVCRCA